MNKKEKREKLCESQNNLCYWCGCKLKKPTLDHLMPKSLGGKNDLSNLVVSCVYCNEKKSDKLINPVTGKPLDNTQKI